MKSIERMPEAKNIPELNVNIEGLKKHSVILVLIPDSSLSLENRKLRTWLLHTLAAAATHYSRARELVQAQNHSDQSRDGGVVLHILDVSEQIEGCVTAMHRVCKAIKRMDSFQPAGEFSRNFKESIDQLCKMRNQYEHMHEQIVASETGPGPISIVFGSEGRSIEFRKLSIKTENLHTLIEAAFKVVACQFPSFDVTAKKETGGPIKLSMTATVSVTDGSGRPNELGREPDRYAQVDELRSDHENH